MKRTFVLGMVLLLLAACEREPGPTGTVEAALKAASAGDRAEFLACYTTEAAEALELVLAAAEGAGWAPSGAIELLEDGALEVLHQDSASAVVSIAGAGEPSLICLQEQSGEWLMTLDRALETDDGWECTEEAQ